jgi:hypothetical protein
VPAVVGVALIVSLNVFVWLVPGAQNWKRRAEPSRSVALYNLVNCTAKYTAGSFTTKVADKGRTSTLKLHMF